MPLPPPPTKRSTALQPLVKDSPEKNAKSSIKKSFLETKSELNSDFIEKKKSSAQEKATDFSTQDYAQRQPGKVDSSATALPKIKKSKKALFKIKKKQH